MKQLLFSVCALLFAPCVFAGYQHPPQAPDQPQERITTYPWSVPAQWHERHREIITRRNMSNINVLFIGDSLINQWVAGGQKAWAEHYRPLRAANFGVGSDTTQNILWRITEGKELLGLSPKVVVILAGINNFNLSDHDAGQVAAGVIAISDTVRQKLPRAQILVLGIFPMGESPEDPIRQKIRDANNAIQAVAADKQVTFLDIGGSFVEPDGRIDQSIMTDYLHLSPEGYAIWARTMNPTLMQLLDR